jgi:cardiolipin synthase
MRRLIRVLFSRFFISGAVILVELVGLAYVVFELSVYSAYFLVLNLFLNLVFLFYVLNTDSNPEYKLTWTYVLIFLPIFGAVLFVLFYKRRMSSKRVQRAADISAALVCGGEDEEVIFKLCECDAYAGGKAAAILKEDRLFSLYTDTVSHYFGSGEEMFSALLSDIREAKEFVFLEYFIIKDGIMWQSLCEALVERAAAGVEIRLLYDDLGCMETLPRGFFNSLSDAGIKVSPFARVTPKVSAVHNNRDHRKICIVDGRVGYTGGVNIGDEYINLTHTHGHWKDGGIRLFGDAVLGLCRLFLMQWGLNTGACEDYCGYLKEEKAVGDGGFYLPFGSGPYPLYKTQIGKRAIMDLINQAKRYLYVTTPYLIVDYDLTEALCGAAGRGVDVRIITPGVADKRMIKLITKSAYPNLLERGVKIYEYTPGFIHEKIIAVDGEYAMVSTINLDYRSLVHHYEDGVWIYNSPVVKEVTAEFLRTIEKSKKIEPGDAVLKPMQRLIRALVKIFAPLL